MVGSSTLRATAPSFRPKESKEDQRTPRQRRTDDFANFGFIVTDIPADNNCLYNAAGVVICGGHGLQLQMRHGAASEIREHQSVCIFHLKVLAAESGRTFEETLDSILTPSTWGGHPELAALCAKYDVNMVIHA
jgi:hypothetical protein